MSSPEYSLVLCSVRWEDYVSMIIDEGTSGEDITVHIFCSVQLAYIVKIIYKQEEATGSVQRV